MNLFNLSGGPLLGIFLFVTAVFIVSLMLSRHQDRQTKWIASAAITLATLFSIETYIVTVGLIPPESYVTGQAAANGSDVLNDWVSSAAVNTGDLIFAWLLVIASITSAYFVKRQQPDTPSSPSRVAFYDQFGTTAALAVMLTSLFYIFIVIPGYFDSKLMLLDKILFRGPIPYIAVGLFIWVILNVALLAKNMVYQRRQDVLVEQIFTQQSEHKKAQLDGIDDQAILKRRLLDIHRTGENQTLDTAEYTQLVEQQSAMEREDVTVSILYLHTAMWAIPVLGFLGTVWGIAEAVANLIPLLKGLSASELGGSQLADSLAGLGVAFDTTLVALSLSLPAMALISLLEKAAHEDMLIRDRIIIRHAKEL